MCILILKALITIAADDIHKYLFIVFQRKEDLMFQVNPLLGMENQASFSSIDKSKKNKMSSVAICFG